MTFDIWATKITHFRRQSTLDKPVTKLKVSATNRDKFDSRLCCRFVASSGDCRRCRKCVPGFRPHDVAKPVTLLEIDLEIQFFGTPLFLLSWWQILLNLIVTNWPLSMASAMTALVWLWVNNFTVKSQTRIKSHTQVTSKNSRDN